MATIRLNNISKPREVLTNKNLSEIPKFSDGNPVYTDLHLDLTVQKNVGLGDKPIDSNDIKVDTDIEAIKNSIRNIFSTRKGQKLLNPDFGTSLEQFLFQSVTEFQANIIGNTILNDLKKYEPRVEVLKVEVVMLPDDNQYNVKLYYKFKKIEKRNFLELFVLNDGQIII